MAIERHTGPTPNGGVRADVVYLDEHGEDATKDDATVVRIIEYDAQGHRIAETYGATGAVRGERCLA